MKLAGFQHWVLGLSRPAKRVIVMAIDCMLCVATVLVAYYLRLGDWVMPAGRQLAPIAVSLVVAIPLFVRLGLYRAIFRYSGSTALGTLWIAGAIYFVVFSTIFTFIGIKDVPRTLGLIQPILLLISVGVARIFAKFWLGGGYARALELGGRSRVMIYGAGSAGRQLAGVLSNSPEMVVVGFVDDDKTLQGSTMNGKPVFGAGALRDLIAKKDVGQLLLAMPGASRSRRAEILQLLIGVPVKVRTLPDMADIARGHVAVEDLRELEIEDLLGRDPVAPNQILLARNITGKTVLVTGAGGSIGSELCRKIMQLRPKCLLLLDSSEFALYAIHSELEQFLAEAASVDLVPLLGSVTDAARMKLVMESWRPCTVYHAAAYKHVPLVEHNPAEGLRNNAFGTLITARAAAANGVRDFVLISTDKAVRPTNVMGASKRLAEMVLQALAHEGTSKTRFSMVRFGNVLGSSGSVVPLFRSQIQAGGPVTITHEEVTRYFMSIPEAAELVIQAGSMAQGGEVFLLDMGEPVRIANLARNMIELSGLQVRDADNPMGDIEISVIGLRPGEKLYEELLIDGDDLPTNHPRIMKAREPMIGWNELAPLLTLLEGDLASNDVVALRKHLTQAVGEFTPDEEVVDHVHRRRSSDREAFVLSR